MKSNLIHLKVYTPKCSFLSSSKKPDPKRNQRPDVGPLEKPDPKCKKSNPRKTLVKQKTDPIFRELTFRNKHIDAGQLFEMRLIDFEVFSNPSPFIKTLPFNRG